MGVAMSAEGILAMPMLGPKAQFHLFMMSGSEALVCCASGVAFCQHFRKNGGQMSELALFHLLHFVYCIGVVCCAAVVANFATDKQLEVSCSAKIEQGIGALPAIALSIAIMRTFFEHWDRIYIHDTQRLKKRQRNRNIFLVIIMLFLVIYTPVQLSAARAEQGRNKWKCMYRVYNYFKVACVVMYFYFFVEFALLIKVYWDQCWSLNCDRFYGARKVHLYGITMVFFDFCCALSIGIMLAALAVYPREDDLSHLGDDQDMQKFHDLNGKQASGIAATNFTFVVPFSYCTLILTWEATYLKEDKDLLQGNLDRVTAGVEMAPGRNYSGEDGWRDRKRNFSLDSDMSTDSIVSEATSDGGVADSDLPPTFTLENNGKSLGENVAKELEYALPRMVEDKADYGSALATILGPSGRDVTITESCRPPEWTLTVVQKYIRAVGLPDAEAFEKRHLAESQKVLEKYRPVFRKDTSLRQLEIKVQFKRFEEKLLDLRSEVKAWTARLRATARLLSRHDGTDSDGGGRAFRPSKHKKIASVQMIPTNLQIQRTSVHRDRESNTSGIDEGTELTVLTYGAPCAHAFGFKFGGLRQAEKAFFEQTAKLEKRRQKSMTDLAAQVDHSKKSLNRLKLKFQLQRASICVSQALGTAVAAALTKIEDCIMKRDSALLRQFNDIGLLLHEVCLLSTHGKEEGMIDDMAGALDRLRLTIRFVDEGLSDERESVSRMSGNLWRSLRVSRREASTRRLQKPTSVFKVVDVQSKPRQPEAEAAEGGLLVTVAVTSQEVFFWMGDSVRTSAKPLTNSRMDVDVHPVLFNLGVNEMQTIANTSGHTQIQTDVNLRGLQDMRQYLLSFKAFEDRNNEVADNARALTAMKRIECNLTMCEGLLNTVEALIEVESSGARYKVVDMLMAGAFAARIMNAARTTSCKSAKDRTSMFHTLETVRLAQCKELRSTEEVEKANQSGGENWYQWMEAFFDAGNAEQERDVLAMLRGMSGTRLNNCYANIGKYAFSFNKLQVQALPAELRPPLSSIGGSKNS